MSRSPAYDARNKGYREALTDSAAFKASSIPTAQRIENDAKELGVKWEAEDVPDGQGARIHWVGDRAAKKVILYFHGDYPPTKHSFRCIDYRHWGTDHCQVVDSGSLCLVEM